MQKSIEYLMNFSRYIIPNFKVVEQTDHILLIRGMKTRYFFLKVCYYQIGWQVLDNLFVLLQNSVSRMNVE